MSKLTLLATAIGSLPYNNTEKATEFIWKNFCDIPFWPQLSQVNSMEDMIIQYSQNIPGMYIDTKQQIFGFNPESDEFYAELEEFYMDYDEIVNEKNFDKLEKYAINSPYSSSIESFCSNIKKHKPAFAKGHITGPFTWGTSICDTEHKCMFYDETYRDIVVKSLTLKALWQIKKMKDCSSSITPIIFIDEPTMSQFGTSAFITVQESDIINALNEIITVINENGAVAAIHCCGKTDWNMLLKTDIKILNFDAFSFTKNLTVYSSQLKTFLNNGGYIAWGIVPTLDVDALTTATVESLYSKLIDGINALRAKGIDKKLILRQSLVTPSCGAGCLDVELAEKAMHLTCTIAKKLRSEYGVI